MLCNQVDNSLEVIGSGVSSGKEKVAELVDDVFFSILLLIGHFVFDQGFDDILGFSLRVLLKKGLGFLDTLTNKFFTPFTVNS